MRSGWNPGVGLFLLLFLSDKGAGAEPTPAEANFFEKEVRPLLVARCLKCHGDERPRGGLKLTSRDHVLRGGDSGPAALAGKPKESLLLRAIRYDEKPRMPPDGKLTPRQIEVLARWVKQGLPWPGATAPAPTPAGRFTITEKQRQFWSFQPVKAVSVPAVRATGWAQSPVDHFILSALEAKGLLPTGPADRRTLLRRVTFDLTGLPPTPAEISAFLADTSPDAFARVVDRLLASPAYGERWGRHWLDVVRYADARDLIQLPAPSDFREVWRYRDWVVSAFNRDLPYTDFLRHQIAGDLLPPPHPGGINRDGLIATGFLALADFVPGDVDKVQMIADYVNDQIDVVGQAFLGLTVACARCHDHKFDPISTEDYYSLAGIFFSTRLIPGPVPGNTPLIRVSLVSPVELAQDAADRRRRAELEQHLAGAADREYLASLKSVVTGQTARYLIAACEHRRAPGPARPSLADLAKRHRLDERLLAGWVRYLKQIEKRGGANLPPALREAVAGKLMGPALERSAGQLQQALAARATRKESPEKTALALASLHRFRADDPLPRTDAGGRILLWPNGAGQAPDARPITPGGGPRKVGATIGGRPRTVVRFDGRALLEVAGRAPPNGTLFVVFQTADAARAGQRLVGWEDSNVGRHGLGLMLGPGGRLHAILRNNGRSGDVVDTRSAKGFETVSVGWGPGGVTLRRNGVASSTRAIAGISADPGIGALRIGGPGSGNAPLFQGDLAELRVYNRQLSDSEHRLVEAELRATWFGTAAPLADPIAEFYAELLSPRGPFWLSAPERAKMLTSAVRERLAALERELALLKRKPPRKVEQAVVVQDGGPKGTRFEGFKDAQVYLRGDHKKPGKTVPRGFPRILTGDRREPIARGSGRLQLADWLARPENPLTARVMVNRIWQHHFGEGLVRTPNNFGLRGEAPTHPELLDYLAGRFVESGWSVKAMHRLILLSAVYQQSSRAGAASLIRDPDNRLFGRMNRRRLEAEAIRDSLLAVAGRLDTPPGGPAFTDLSVPRRTLYLMSVRTGPSTSDFGRLFDRADPGSIVARRGESVVAPQALFFLNDPVVGAWSRDLAARVAREAPAGHEVRIRHLYLLVLGRPPTRAEIDLARRLLAPAPGVDVWERYCQLLLCTNEFVYLD